MKHRTTITGRSIALMLAFCSPLGADPSPLTQSQVSFTAGSAGTWNSDWQGAPHRVYFMLWSLDLVSWNFCPFMHFGEGLQSRGMNSSTPKFFIRLFYYDDPNIATLEQAQNHDLDGDGVSNIDEIKILGTRPNQFSTNGSGISDGAQDWDDDGISNADEVALGLDPGVNNTNGASGVAAVEYTYDDTNRLTGTTSPVAATSYDLDEEGNIK